MRRKAQVAIGAAVIAGATLLGGSLAYAASTEAPDSEETETAITGDALRQASEAALAATGGGTVTGTEVGDEESYYEVEVTLADGSQVDVQLDEGFAVVGSTPDSETDE